MSNETNSTPRPSPAAKAAGDWWAARLHRNHAGKHEAFAAAVAERVDQAMRGEKAWTHSDELIDGDGKPREWVFTECDYDPRGLLHDAVVETVDANCIGYGFSARGILPEKHSLRIYSDRLEPKEGYGNWTAPIFFKGDAA